MNTENPCFKIRRGVNSNPSPVDNLRLELNPKGFLLPPYHHLELVTFESGDGQDTLTLSFLNRTVLITGKNLRDWLWHCKTAPSSSSASCPRWIAIRRWLERKLRSRPSESRTKKSRVKMFYAAFVRCVGTMLMGSKLTSFAMLVEC